MQLELHIGYNELIRLIRQLPPAELQRLREDIVDLAAPTISPIEPNNLQQLLLKGPTMSLEQAQHYNELHNYMNSLQIESL
ncbi:MAG TPA: hypothetical protein PLC89_28310 [Haliscomenobacter sp.]|uniref:hypothetical protein n=1 Tax=Haliscomenobacter sp. TaxID=2717303 RepID=UPI002C0B1C49|nr:hypothetical protein [Haliscomenobacter sp.]HOY21251.1 hypothetical protein [Haliscomenobacter sp.]